MKTDGREGAVGSRWGNAVRARCLASRYRWAASVSRVMEVASNPLSDVPRSAASTFASWMISSSSWTVTFRFMPTVYRVAHVIFTCTTVGPVTIELDLSVDPVDLTAALVDIPSVSATEEPLADAIERALRALGHLEVVRSGNSVLARTNLGRDSRVVFAGHIDTSAPLLEDRKWVLGSTSPHTPGAPAPPGAGGASAQPRPE